MFDNMNKIKFANRTFQFNVNLLLNVIIYTVISNHSILVSI